MLNKLLSLCGVMFLIIPYPLALADHVPTQTPYDISIVCDSDGDTTKGNITVTWQESDGFESSPPERYAIAFSNDNFVETNYAVANSTGWETALSYKSYVFTASYRETIFGTTADTFYAKVRADNDTDASYSEWTGVISIDCNYGSTATTTSSTTTSSTTTTTTVPPKPEPKPEPYVEPEPLPPPPEEIIVDIVVEGVDKTYTQADVNDGTIERDQERIDNEAAYGCFMTDAQIDRGDCIIIKEEVIDEEIIIEDKENVEIVIPEDVVEVFDTPEEKKVEIEILEFEEQPIEFEVIEFDLEDVAPKDVVEIPIQDEIIEDIIQDELDETLSIDDEITEDEIQVENNDDKIIQEIVESEEEIELIEVEEAIKEIVKVEEIIELKNQEELNTLSQEEVVIYEEEVKAAIVEYVEDLDQEDQIEVIKEVTDIGITNLDKATKETKQVVQAVVNEVTKVENVETLTEEQTEVVADILGFEKTEDVAIIAEAASKEENIAQAVDEYVERASDNANVENYNLSDVVVEIAVENFIADPISIIQIDFNEITISNISSDMTSSQKEKAQEVVVPVILARIATIGSFIMRKSF